jgi:hypothetical protein
MTQVVTLKNSCSNPDFGIIIDSPAIRHDKELNSGYARVPLVKINQSKTQNKLGLVKTN